MKTKYGWLLVYQGVSGWDPELARLGLKPEQFKVNDWYRYKIGVMLLDKRNPERVIYRPNLPALEPEKWYEGAIIYPCGAVIHKNKLFVYYGAGDYHVALATLDLAELRSALRCA